MGSTCKQGKPNGNQKTGGYRIGQKTIQKAKAHPKRRKDLWHKDTFLLEKRATYLTNKKKGGEIGDR